MTYYRDVCEKEIHLNNHGNKVQNGNMTTSILNIKVGYLEGM